MTLPIDELRIEAPSPIALETHPSPPPPPDYIPIKPKLPLESLFANMADSADALASEEMKRNIDRIMAQSSYNSKKQAEILKAEQETATHTSHQSIWKMLGNLAICLSAAASIVIGIMTGGVPGILLAAAGVTSVVSLTLSNLGVSPMITGTLALVAAGAGVAGTALNFAVAAGQIATTVAGVLNAALAITQAALSLTKGWTEANLAWLRAKMEELSFGITGGQIKMGEINQESSDAVETALDRAKKAAELMSKHQEIKQQILIRV
ncbi:MAG: hypothetical protein KBC64_00025 [Simkaniaceae bacterium]|nr:hypothetical protein [Simkaniaceae bacterium]